MEEIIYSSDKKTLLRFPEDSDILSFECPPFVEIIGAEAFAKITKLKELTIPETIKEVGVRAFYKSEIRIIRIINTKLKIGEDAFRWCSSTEIFYIPKHSPQTFRNKIAKFVWDNSELIREELESPQKLSKDDLDFENEIIRLALKSNAYSFAYLKPSIKNNIDIIKEAIKFLDGSIFKYANVSLRQDKKVIDELVEINGGILPYAIGDYLNNREYILKASRTYPGIIGHIKNNEFRTQISKDIEIIQNILKLKVNRGIFAPMQYVHESLKSDRELVLNAVKNCGFNFRDVDVKFCCDREIVLYAVRTAGYLLGKACAELKDDEEIVKIAITHSGENLKFASDRIKGIKEFALLSVKSYGRAYQVISEELMNDKEIAFAAVKNAGSVALFFTKGEIFMKDPDIIKLAAEYEENYRLLENQKLNSSTPKKMTEDKDFVINAVSKDGASLEYASLKLRKDKDVIRTAVSNNGIAYLFSIL